MGPPKVPDAGRLPPSKSDQTMQSVADERPCQSYDYPTVLVARRDDGLDRLLAYPLRRNGFDVLEADSADVLDVIKVHSRPIHLLVADVSVEASVSILRIHQSDLKVLLVKGPCDASDVLAKVRQLLGSPPSP